MRLNAPTALIAILGVSTCATALGAGTIADGSVIELLNDVAYPNLVFVSVAGSKVDSPSCHTHPVWEFVLDASTQQGILQYAMLLSSLKDGLTVDLFGGGTCDLNSGTETLKRIELH
jgi:hypothetical protein